MKHLYIFTLSALVSMTYAQGVQETTPIFEELLREGGNAGGVVAHVGCGAGEETAELASAAGESFLVQGLDSDRQDLERARRNAVSLDLNGRLTFRHWSDNRLPYADNIVNVIFWDDAEKDPDMSELMRVLVPHGKAYIRQGDGWREDIKPWPADIDDWSHYRYDAGNTGGSSDERVGPPEHIQWEAGPRFMRSHELETGLSSLVSTAGRIYYILDEGPIGITDARFPAKWSLVCRDAFNGVLLWKRPLEDWGWQSWKKNRENIPEKWFGQGTRSADVDRLMVAEGDNLYVKLGFHKPVSAVDGRSGEVLRTYEQTKHTKEFIILDGILLAFKKKPEPTILAVSIEDGKLLWQHESSSTIMDRSLCAAGKRVFYHGRGTMISLDLERGEELWKGKTDLKPATVLAHENAVLAAHSCTTLALSPQTGERLWKGPGAGAWFRQSDLFVVGDQVWWGHGSFESGLQQGQGRFEARLETGHGRFEARRIETGEKIREMKLQSALISGHHRRCYIDRASANYMITGRRGSEFLDLQGNEHKRHNWLRGPCVTGMTPANGLFYVPPHQCFCYAGVRMDGFFALSSSLASSGTALKGYVRRPRLEKGPAYTAANENSAARGQDWPMYRHDNRRSGSVVSKVPADIEQRWSANMGGNLTQPIVVGGKLFVAQKDAGALHCLDVETGETAWSYAVAGRIDSPPSYHEGYVLFGSHDGFVYSLHARDGELAWRFRVAPQERQIISRNRLASAWPSHGSVPVIDGLVYCTAGRSSFLDGGIYLFALDAISGETVHRTRLQGPSDDISEASYGFDEEGYRDDLLTTDGRYIYMRRTVFDRDLQEVEPRKFAPEGRHGWGRLEYRKMPGMRLVATGGFMDHTFFNRTWWMHSRIWPGGQLLAQQAPKSGQMLVFDEGNTYTVKHYTTRSGHSPMFFPGSGYLLFADENGNEPILYSGKGKPKPIEWEPELPGKASWAKSIYQDARIGKGVGFTRAQPALWTSWVDVRVEAMVLAGDTLFVAGPPDVVPEDDPLAALEDRRGGILRAVSAGDGGKLHEIELDNPPVFDGLIAAKGKLYMSNIKGEVLCFGEK